MVQGWSNEDGLPPWDYIWLGYEVLRSYTTTMTADQKGRFYELVTEKGYEPHAKHYERIQLHKDLRECWHRVMVLEYDHRDQKRPVPLAMR